MPASRSCAGEPPSQRADHRGTTLNARLTGTRLPGPDRVDALTAKTCRPRGDPQPHRRGAGLPGRLVELAAELRSQLAGAVGEAEDRAGRAGLGGRPEGDPGVRGDVGRAAVARRPRLSDAALPAVHRRRAAAAARSPSGSLPPPPPPGSSPPPSSPPPRSAGRTRSGSEQSETKPSASAVARKLVFDPTATVTPIPATASWAAVPAAAGSPEQFGVA